MLCAAPSFASRAARVGSFASRLEAAPSKLRTVEGSQAASASETNCAAASGPRAARKEGDASENHARTTKGAQLVT
jgi:hypothetical protein